MNPTYPSLGTTIPALGRLTCYRPNERNEAMAWFGREGEELIVAMQFVRQQEARETNP